MGDKQAQPFCENGDSGVFIIDHLGQAVAQLFGFLKSHCGGPPPTRENGKSGTYYAATTGFVTPMDRIIENVELMTAPKEPTTGQRTGPGAILDIFDP